MEPKTLDHVAFWLADREPIAEFLTTKLGLHVIDRQDNFTLVGADARRGKLTLFDAEGPREQGAFKHVALRVSSLDDGKQTDFDIGEGRIRGVSSMLDDERLQMTFGGSGFGGRKRGRADQLHFRYQGDSQLLDATGAVLATVSVPESVVLPQSERDVVVKFEPRLPASALSVVTRLDVGLPERLEIETRVSAAESGR